MGAVYVTKQMIWEAPYTDVDTLQSVTLSNIVGHFQKHAQELQSGQQQDVESYSDGIVTTA
jgi:hypothetical protein